MRAIKRDLPQDLDRVEIYIFSDWRLGDKACNKAAIEEQLA